MPHDEENGPLLIEPGYVWPNHEVISTQELTCINHLDLRWVTKNIRSRNLHYLSYAPECACPISDLRVVLS